MRTTIADLVLATETAERAIAALRATLGESDRTLGERLRTAERYSADLANRVHAGESVMSRIAQIVDTSRRAAEAESAPPAPQPANDANEALKLEPEQEGESSSKEGLLKAAAALAEGVALMETDLPRGPLIYGACLGGLWFLANVLFGAVVDVAMTSELRSDWRIDRAFVGHQV